MTSSYPSLFRIIAEPFLVFIDCRDDPCPMNFPTLCRRHEEHPAYEGFDVDNWGRRFLVVFPSPYDLLGGESVLWINPQVTLFHVHSGSYFGSVYDLLRFVGRDLICHCMSDVFRYTHESTSFFFRIGGEGILTGMIVYRFIKLES
jgi:hypothetical protein